MVTGSMATNENEEDRIQRLREKRMRLAKEKEDADKRARHGLSVVAKTNLALGTSLTVEGFDIQGEFPVQLEMRSNLADCRGLVAAHISEKRIREIIACCDAIVRPVTGTLGFDEYRFVGTVKIKSTTLMALLDAAKALHDSVIFCPAESGSVVLLDHYKVSGMERDVGFSIVIQGASLEARLAACFQNVAKL
jgi:hypothetical protein